MLKIASDAASADDRIAADLISSYGSEAVTKIHKGEVVVENSGLSFGNNQSGRQLLRDTGDLAVGLETRHIRECVSKPWLYDENIKTLKWDPSDFRPYALRDVDPGSEKVYGSRGGNLLGFYGLSMLPAFPSVDGLSTTGLSMHKRDGPEWDTSLTWAILVLTNSP